MPFGFDILKTHKESLRNKLKKHNDADKCTYEDESHIYNKSHIYIRFQPASTTKQWVEMKIQLTDNKCYIECVKVVTHFDCTKEPLSCIRETEITFDNNKKCVIKEDQFCGISDCNEKLKTAEYYYNELLDWVKTE